VQRPLKKSIVATAAAIAGFLWAPIQVVFTLLVLETEATLGCSLGPRTALSVVTVLMLASGLAAVGLGVVRGLDAALKAFAAQAFFVVLWFALGGWSAAGCALGV
jgi:hypothetical protein